MEQHQAAIARLYRAALRATPSCGSLTFTPRTDPGAC
jgi:hypothetical protein